MEIIAKKHPSDKDMVELYVPHTSGQWLMAVSHVDCIAQDILELIEEEESVKLKLEVAG